MGQRAKNDVTPIKMVSCVSHLLVGTAWDKKTLGQLGHVGQPGHAGQLGHVGHAGQLGQ